MLTRRRLDGAGLRMAGRLDLAVLIAAFCLTLLCFVRLHVALGPSQAPPLALFQASRRLPLAGYGWWSWWDQSAYIQATLAWANGVLDPAYHWFLPGYALLGAPFVRITPAEPFLLPDLACLLGSLWLFAGLAARLMGEFRHGRAVGAAVFVATAVWSSSRSGRDGSARFGWPPRPLPGPRFRCSCSEAPTLPRSACGRAST